MEDKVTRLLDIFSITEQQFIHELHKIIGDSRIKLLLAKDIPKEIGCSPAVSRATLRLLQVADIVDVDGAGTRGTYITVINRKLFDALADSIGVKYRKI